jgi:hypothetical protein
VTVERLTDEETTAWLNGEIPPYEVPS